MINITDYTYFKGKLLVPNAVEDTDVQAYLATLTTEFQYDFLIDLLGNTLYPQFVTWFGVDPLDTANPFNGLLEGKNFELDGKDYVWVGLRNTQKVSPLANYVYCKYMELKAATQSVSTGETKGKSKNSEPANPTTKIVTQWNNMVDMLCSYQAYMEKFFASSSMDYCKEIFNLRNSLGL